MKNSMKLIMENWRGNVLQEQDVSYPKDSVFQFLKDLTDSIGEEKTIEQKIVKAIKTTRGVADDTKAKVIKTMASKGLMLGLATLVGVGTGNLLPLTGAAIGMLVDETAQQVVGKVKKKIEAFSVPDVDRDEYPTSELWDVSDDLINILKGPDEKFDRKEFNSIIPIYTRVVQVLEKIKEEEKKLIKAGDTDAYRAFLSKPITSYNLPNADEAAKANYANIVNIQKGINIPPA